MAFDNGSEEPPTMTQKSDSWLQTLGHRLTVRLVLLLGVVVFLTAVGIDSLQQASAADMPNPHPTPVTIDAAIMTRRPQTSQVAPHQGVQKSYWEFDREIANRLEHSDLTRASLTRSRLTSSHLFTRYAR
jgi:hypothetical protein